MAGIGRTGEGRIGSPKKPSLRSQKKYHANHMDKALQVITMQAMGIRKSTIATKLGITRPTVDKYLKEKDMLFPHLSETVMYETQKQKLISATESYALQSISNLLKPESTPTLRDATQTFKVLHNSNRLEQDKSTNNLSARIQYAITPLASLKNK